MNKLMIDKIEWNEEKMSVGNDTIDKQHRDLLIIINKLILSINKETQIEDIEDILTHLNNNVKTHFKTEEALFNKLLINEKDIEQHLLEHRKFEEVIDKINYRIKNEENFRQAYAIETLTELFSYISGWFVNHDIKEDKLFFQQTTK